MIVMEKKCENYELRSFFMITFPLNLHNTNTPNKLNNDESSFITYSPDIMKGVKKQSRKWQKTCPNIL